MIAKTQSQWFLSTKFLADALIRAGPWPDKCISEKLTVAKHH